MPNDASVYFADGIVKAKDWIILVTELRSLADRDAEGDFSRGFSLKAGQWGRFDFPDLGIVSVAALPPPARGTYFLAKDGHLVLIVPDGRRYEEIADAGTGPGKLGYVTRIREIDGEFFVCGAGGQIYRREGDQWVHCDEGVRNPSDGAPPADLYGMDGISPRDLFAVGTKGSVWHLDGDHWIRETAPAAVTLAWVRSISRDQVYVCGKKGVFLSRESGQWRDLSNPEIKVDFWSLEVFAGRVYLAAGPHGLYVYDGKKIQPLNTGLEPALDGNKLYAADGVLWSFGIEHLGCFDGNKWTYERHPDNP